MSDETTPNVIPEDLKNDLTDFISRKVVEERENIGKLIDICLSAYTREPKNAVILGPHDSGKTWLVLNTVEMFPDEDTFIGTMSLLLLDIQNRVILNPDPNADEENKYTEIIEVDGQKTTVDKYIDKLYADIKTAKSNKDEEKIYEKISKIRKQTYPCIDFRNKILLFPEEPIIGFWRKILSVVSKDGWWHTYKFELVGGTRKILFRGHPVVIYCTTKIKNTDKKILGNKFEIIEPVQTERKYNLAVQQIFDDLNLKRIDYEAIETESGLRIRLRNYINLLKKRQGEKNENP